EPRPGPSQGRRADCPGARANPSDNQARGIRPEKPELVLWKVLVCREKPAWAQQIAVAVAADDPLREPIRGNRRPPRIMGADLRCGVLKRLPETRYVLAQFARHHIAPVKAKAAEACRGPVGQ